MSSLGGGQLELLRWLHEAAVNRELATSREEWSNGAAAVCAAALEKLEEWAGGIFQQSPLQRAALLLLEEVCFDEWHRANGSPSRVAPSVALLLGVLLKKVLSYSENRTANGGEQAERREEQEDKWESLKRETQKGSTRGRGWRLFSCGTTRILPMGREELLEINSRILSSLLIAAIVHDCDRSQLMSALSVIVRASLPLEGKEPRWQTTPGAICEWISSNDDRLFTVLHSLLLLRSKISVDSEFEPRLLTLYWLNEQDYDSTTVFLSLLEDDIGAAAFVSELSSSVANEEIKWRTAAEAYCRSRAAEKKKPREMFVEEWLTMIGNGGEKVEKAEEDEDKVKKSRREWIKFIAERRACYKVTELKGAMKSVSEFRVCRRECVILRDTDASSETRTGERERLHQNQADISSFDRLLLFLFRLRQRMHVHQKHTLLPSRIRELLSQLEGDQEKYEGK